MRRGDRRLGRRLAVDSEVVAVAFVLDAQERAGWSLFSADLLLQRRFARLVRDVLSHGRATHRALTSDSVDVVTYDPATLERLRELGYL